MYKISLMLIITFFGVFSIPAVLLAALDQYPGDTSIYGGVVSQIQPNVLILLDTTGSMDDQVIASQTNYENGTNYPTVNKCGSHGNSSCARNTVYTASNYSVFLSSVDNVTTSCNGNDPKLMLNTTGMYSGRRLNNDGTCRSSGTGSYLLGNYINWLNGSSTVYKSKLAIAKEVIANLLNSTTGVNFGVMRFDTTNTPRFLTTSYTVSGTTYNYTTTIKNTEDVFTAATNPATTNKAAIIKAVNALSTGGSTPLGEAMFEAMRYFQGGAPAFGSTVGVTAGKYTSPISASCQKNYLILLTDGMSNSDDSTALLSTIGDFDGDHVEPTDYNHIADDIAKYIYDTDMSNVYDGKQNITTFTIGFGLAGSDTTAVNLLQRAADNQHGNGQAYLASNQSGLATSLTQIVSSILDINTSFVAPVVPVSPENKTASASRMYLGMFRPLAGTCWSGNLKKYGIDTKGYLVDKQDPAKFVNYIDVKNNSTNVMLPDGNDDRSGDSLVLGSKNGSFIPGTISYWNTTSDAGQVEEGGVGESLLDRTAPRNIYTYMNGSSDLTNSTNRFDISNDAITYTTLGVANDTAKYNLIRYVHGYDAYGENTSDTTLKREWILGDILHAKPVIINYSKYTFNSTNESNCDTNKSIIFVGANDGMLHAFKDCDGSELWAFIPPDTLPNLQYIRSSNHTTLVDSTVSTYIYDSNKDGNIVAEGGDKAIILFGQRRGGGSSGFYYALDVTTPASPQLLGKISNATTGYSELAETWSEPRIAKVRTSSTAFKIAAIFGAGYDNLNEDRRYGAKETFPDTSGVAISNTGAGAIDSSGTSAPLNPKGRGIYVMEIASLTDNVPNFSTFGNKIWGYTYAENAAKYASLTPALQTALAMSSSFPSELSLLDTDGVGYINRIYAVDAGANLWRFDIGTGDTSTWKGKKIFASNIAADGGTIGRKAFFKPTITLEVGYDMVFFGTGDREHPQNKNVLDRVYGIKVRDDYMNTNFVQTETTGPNNGLYDVTLDQLQNTAIANTGGASLPTEGSEAYIFKQLNEKNGWYIKLNEVQGEKMLSSPIVYNKEMFFTTYVPQTVANPDPCQPSNLGYSNAYIVGHLTGAAVKSFDTSNDKLISGTLSIAAAKNEITNNGVNMAAYGGTVTGGNSTTVTNLKRSDRKVTSADGIGGGISSSPVFDGKNIIIQGGRLITQETKKGGLVKPLYWIQK